METQPTQAGSNTNDVIETAASPSDALAVPTMGSDWDYFLGLCSLYAYENEAFLTTMFEGSNSKWIFDPAYLLPPERLPASSVDKNLQVFVIYSKSESDPQVVVAFRGTANWENWLKTNVFARWPAPWPGKDGVVVGSGFYHAWADYPRDWLINTLYDVIRCFQGVRPRITFTGHSLGAALAQIAFFDLATGLLSNDGCAVSMTSFASPLVGNQDYASAYQQLLLTASQGMLTSKTYMNPNDPVITLANSLMSAAYLSNQTKYVAAINSTLLPEQITAHAMSVYLHLLQLADTPAADLVGSSDATELTLVVKTMDVKYEDTFASLAIPYPKVSFTYGMNGDGTGGSSTPLLRLDGVTPFRPGQTDTFVLLKPKQEAWNAQQDLARCQLELVPPATWPESSMSQWAVESVQVILEGVVTNHLPAANTHLNTANLTFRFSGLAPTALACGIEWAETPQGAEVATGPAVAMSSEGTIVWVTVKSDGTFQYECGTIQDDLRIEWGPSGVYEPRPGETPKVAMSADGTWTVDVHKGSKTNNLYSRTGKVNNTSSGLTITWSESESYDTGGSLTPAVAILGDAVVEVHKSSHNDGLFYHVGNYDHATSVVKWVDTVNGTKIIGANNQHTQGKTPAVAVTPDGRVIVVFQDDKTTKLYYQIGTLVYDSQGKASAIDFSTSKPQYYDPDGYNPSVAVDRYGRVLVAHKGARGTYYRPGSCFSGQTITWDQEHPTLVFDTGGNTGVALNDRQQAALVYYSVSMASQLSTGTWATNPFDVPKPA